MTASMDEILEDPKAHFETPGHILEKDNLDSTGKRKILEAWREDAEALERAKDEGMSGGVQSWLQDVNEALEKL